MAYNRKYLLHRIIEVKELVRIGRKRGQSQIWIYNNQVKDRYHISFATFNNYLAVNAARELKELEAREAESRRQLCLFDSYPMSAVSSSNSQA